MDKLQNLNVISCLLQVPRVFINGKFVGGGDDIVTKDGSGALRKLLEA